MNYKKGDIVVVKFPFVLRERGIARKGRPALIIFNDKIKRRYNDVILVAITSHIPENILESEIILKAIKSSGLLKKSLLRLDFIMTVPEDLISRKIGVLPEDQIKRVERKLTKLFDIRII